MQERRIYLTRDEALALRKLALCERTTVAEVLRRFALAEAVRRGLYPAAQQAGEAEQCARQ